MRDALREDTSPRVTSERRAFEALLDAWAAQFDVETMLEGPIDGVDGPGGVHGVSLARRGVKVVAAVPSEAHAANVREIYAREASDCDVVVTGTSAEGFAELPRSDMVVSYEALGHVPDWRQYLVDLAKLARNVMVVVVRNPDHWSVKAADAVARLRGERGSRDERARETWRTELLAPELWKFGRVRTHEYFAGEALVDDLAATLAVHPLLAKLVPKVHKRTSSLHALVVDMRPRTPRERRRLAQVDR